MSYRNFVVSVPGIYAEVYSPNSIGGFVHERT